MARPDGPAGARRIGYRTFWLGIVLLVGVNYFTPSPVFYESPTGVPVDVCSYNVVAQLHGSALNSTIVRGHKRPTFKGLRALPAAERNRCWALLREIVKVFLFAPDRVASLERVVNAYAEDLPPSHALEVGGGTATPDDSASYGIPAG
jgi:hypothetical protein